MKTQTVLYSSNTNNSRHLLDKDNSKKKKENYSLILFIKYSKDKKKTNNNNWLSQNPSKLLNYKTLLVIRFTLVKPSDNLAK